jgi:hypothetical protein
MHKEVKNDKKKNIGKTLRASLMDSAPNPLLFFPFLFSTKKAGWKRYNSIRGKSPF